MAKLQGTALLAAVTTLTSMGFLMIGYDNGLMGGLVNGPAFNSTFDTPGPVIQGFIVACFDLGAFLGSVASATFGERLGRRKSIAVGVLVMLAGALLQATAYTRAHMIVARIVSGMGMGIINSTVPVFQAEFSPKVTRGLYVCMQLSTLNLGICIVYWVDYGFSGYAGSFAWRVPVILQCIFLFPMLLLIAILPESPRWLAAHDRPDESLEVLRRIKAGQLDDETILALHADILKVAADEAAMGSGSWKTLLQADRIHSRRRLLIACSVQAFQQLGGINAIIYYSGTLFANVGFDNQRSALMSGFLQLWFFVASFIPWFLIDRIGRRPLFLSMISLMAAVMAVQAGLVYQVQYDTAIAYAAGIGGAAMLFVFQGAFTIGFQATVWVYPSEILPLRLRQKGSSLSTASNWICNFIIVMITPDAISNIGWKTYIIFAVLNATWVPIIYVFYPESKGMELEDFDRLFAGEDVVPIMQHTDEEGVEVHMGEIKETL
ncbi:hypothetical protein MMC30_003729 [Trapelia coarctata]|nr:hypothetical protein [Trapelia coarctata]